MRCDVAKIFFTCLIYGVIAIPTAELTSESTTEKINSTNVEKPPKKLKIAIYYEALCPDSSDFINNQFAPAYDSIKQFIDVLFVPFGKSQSENNGSNFFCQHGPAECTGNRLQSCVIEALADDQDAKVKFVNCQMKSNADYTAQQCASSVNVTNSDLTTFSDGQKGIELQLNAEKKTHTIARPYPSFIPTIVFDERYSRQNQWRSLRDFKRLACDKLLPIFKTSNELSQTCA